LTNWRRLANGYRDYDTTVQSRVTRIRTMLDIELTTEAVHNSLAEPTPKTLSSRRRDELQ